jgi:hypothetical protein
LKEATQKEHPMGKQPTPSSVQHLHEQKPRDPEQERVHRFVETIGLQRGIQARLCVEDMLVYKDGTIWINLNDGDAIVEVSVLHRRKSVVLVVKACVTPMRWCHARFHCNRFGYSEEQVVRCVLHALCMEKRHP